MVLLMFCWFCIQPCEPQRSTFCLERIFLGSRKAQVVPGKKMRIGARSSHGKMFKTSCAAHPRVPKNMNSASFCMLKLLKLTEVSELC